MTDAQEFWLAWPEEARSGKIACMKAYTQARKKYSHEEIMGRLRAFIGAKSKIEWYNFCYPQKFLNQYLEDYEPEKEVKDWRDYDRADWVCYYSDKREGHEGVSRFMLEHTRNNYPDMWAATPDFIKKPKMEIVGG